MATYELFYGSGGHGGPYWSLDSAVRAARRFLRGCRSERYVDIRERGREALGGVFGTVVKVIYQEKA